MAGGFCQFNRPEGGLCALPEPERPDADVVVQRFLRKLNTDCIKPVLLHCAPACARP